MLKRNLFAVILCGLFVPAHTQFRQYANEFLNIGAGARGLAMGGAQVASAGDHTAGYWNPAGLALVKDYPSLGIMHAEYFSGIGKYDYAAAAIPSANEKNTFGISLLRFGVDDIPNTLFLVEPDGSLNYNNIRSFSSADYALLLSIGHSLIDNDDVFFAIGGNAKIIYRQVGTFAKAFGFGFDAGAMYHNNGWRLGINIKDVTSTFTSWSFSFSDREKEILYLTQNEIPVKSLELTAPRFVIAVAKEIEFNNKLKLLAEADAELSFAARRNTFLSNKIVNADPKAGVELSYNNVLHVRAGVSNFQKGLADGDTLNQKRIWIFQPSIGVGFKIGNATINYAFTNLANQSNPLYSHIFSLQIDLIKKEKN